MRGARRWVDGGALPRCRRRARTRSSDTAGEGVCMVSCASDGPDRVYILQYTTTPERAVSAPLWPFPDFGPVPRCRLTLVRVSWNIVSGRIRGRALRLTNARYRRDKRLTAYTSAPATTEHTRRVSRVLGSSRFSSNHCSDRGSQSCLASQPSPPSRGLSQQLLLTAPAIAAGLCGLSMTACAKCRLANF